MSEPTQIIDRVALARRLARASQANATNVPEHPLLQRVAEDICDRLATVLRAFPHAAVIAPHAGRLAAKLSEMTSVGDVVDARLLRDGGDLAVDDEALPFPLESLDLLVSSLTLQATNDLPGALIQARRALRPDGLFVGVLLGGETLVELRSALLEAESETTGGASPRVLPFANVRDLGGLLQRAGFALPVADTDTVQITYPTPLALLEDLRLLGATNTMAARTRRFTSRGLLLRAMQIYAERHGMPDGRVSATVELTTLTGWAPHDSQQQPLKPGSAATRLAEALGVPEGAPAERNRSTD